MNSLSQSPEHTLEKGVVDSLYGESVPLLVGTLNCVVATVLCYFSAKDPAFLITGAVFLLVGLPRFALLKAYRAADAKPMSEAQLARWKQACIVAGTLVSAALGFFCFQALVWTTDVFAQLVAVTVAIANTVGVAARNFGSSRYVMWQTVSIGIPLIGGLVLYRDALHWGLAGLYFTYLVAVVGMASSLRKVLHSALRREAEVSKLAGELGIALETMPNGLLVFDDNNLLKLCNADAIKMLTLEKRDDSSRYSVDEVFGLVLQNFSVDDGAVERMRADFSRIDQIQQSGPFILKDMEGSSFKFIMKQGSNGSLVVRVDDITAEEQAQKNMQAMARYDALTGLANRGWFFEQMGRQQSQLNRDKISVLAAVDLDDFKGVNDTYGHPVGDALLQTVAKRLSGIIGSEDICSRFGGDEFVLFVSVDRNSRLNIETLAQEISDCVNGPCSIRGVNLELGGSVGICVDSGNRNSIEELITQADYALYEAKNDEHIRYSIFAEDMRGTMLRQKRLKVDLKEAVECNSLNTVFQPIVNTKTGQVADFEALCRWTHDELGPIGPDEFIPIAETTGLVSKITHLQLHAACNACARLPEHVGVSVNLSGIDFRSTTLLNSISSAIRQAGIDASRLTVEVTETSLLDLKSETIKIVEDIRALGIQVALDDFGVGYSSLSYLHKLPLDRIKIDRSFVVQMDESDKTLKLMKTVGRLAKEIDMEMVIEGIETEEQLNKIRSEVDTDLFQGYLFSPPMPESAIVEYCSRAFAGSEAHDEIIVPLNLKRAGG